MRILGRIAAIILVLWGMSPLGEWIAMEAGSTAAGIFSVLGYIVLLQLFHGLFQATGRGSDPSGIRNKGAQW